MNERDCKQTRGQSGSEYATRQTRRTVVSRLGAVPEGGRDKGSHAALEAWLLAFGRDPLVDALAEPDARAHVPVVEQDLVVLGRLDPEDVHVSASVPARATGDGVVSVEAEPAKDDRTLEWEGTKGSA